MLLIQLTYLFMFNCEQETLSTSRFFFLISKASSPGANHTMPKCSDEQWDDASLLACSALKGFPCESALKAKDLQSAWNGNLLWTAPGTHHRNLELKHIWDDFWNQTHWFLLVLVYYRVVHAVGPRECEDELVPQ